MSVPKIRGDAKNKKPEIELGDEVQDLISGFKGIVTAKASFVAGCRRLGVDSQELIDGKPVERQYFDEPNLKIVKSGKLKPKKCSKQKINLGDEIECKMNGHRGIAATITEYFSGSRLITLSPQVTEKNGTPAEPISYDENMIEKVSKKKIEEESTASQRRGGNQYPGRSFL